LKGVWRKTKGKKKTNAYDKPKSLDLGNLRCWRAHQSKRERGRKRKKTKIEAAWGKKKDEAGRMVLVRNGEKFKREGDKGKKARGKGWKILRGAKTERRRGKKTQPTGNLG